MKVSHPAGIGAHGWAWSSALAGAAVSLALVASGCGSTVVARLPTSVAFSPAQPTAPSPNCQQSAAGGGAEVTGGPSVNYVVASSSEGQLFAWCNLLAFRRSPAGPWQVHHLDFDMTAAALLSGDRVFGLGYQFAGGGLRLLSIQGSLDPAVAWTATPMSAVHPATYDSLSCSPSGAICAASPGAITLWAQLCPQSGMGQPPPPNSPSPLPLFVYQAGSGWSQLGNLPAGAVFPSATVTQAGSLLVGGSRGGRGLIELSQNGGRTFQVVDSPAQPVAAIATAGQHGVAVGGTPGCATDPAAAASPQEVLETSNGGGSWQAEDVSGRNGLPLAAVALSSSGLAAIGAGVDPVCGELSISGCYPSLLTVTPSGGLAPPTGLALQPSAFSAGPGSNLLTLTAQGLLISSSDGGRSWQIQESVTPPQVTAVQFFSGHPQIGVAQVQVGATELSLQTTDGGRAWADGPALPTAATSTISWGSLQVGYAVTNSGSLLKTTDRGRTWRRLIWPGQGLQVVALMFQSAARGWVEVDVGAGSDAVEVLQTGDGGRRWTPLKLAGLAGPSAPADFAAAEIGGRTVVVTLYEWGWRTWTGDAAPRSVAVKGPLLPQAVTVSPTGSIWALGIKGWWYRPAPTMWVGGKGQAAAASLGLPTSTAPSAIGFTSADDGWLLGSGTLFRTLDGGTRWFEVPLRFSTVDGISLP